MNAPQGPDLSRRAALGLTAAAVGAATLPGCTTPVSDGGKAITRGQIKQSIVYWCFHSFGEKWDIDTMCRKARSLGCVSIELCSSKHYPVLKKHGLISAIAPNGVSGRAFMKGLNNTDFHKEIFEGTRKNIDACSEFGFPNVIAFNGYKWRDPANPKSGEISLEEGAKNVISGLKELARYGEKKNVTINIEMLNTRDDSSPSHGHPGYQGDDMDYVADIVKAVGSERVKILFDIYHVQIMNGDVIRRLKQYKDLIGHIHTAGNPGRGELDDTQEIHYPGCMKALLDIGYTGYVGQEFIPTRDAYQGLHEACHLCDV